ADTAALVRWRRGSCEGGEAVRVRLDILPHLEAEARERMLAGVAQDPVERIPQGSTESQRALTAATVIERSEGKSRDQAAELVGAVR
ncbi:MAG: hypothetical protein WBO04_08095, partial [Steroidobacteraceae bacterium]